MLEITKQLFFAGNYHEGYRESSAELFFENKEHFRQEFLEIIPYKYDLYTSDKEKGDCKQRLTSTLQDAIKATVSF